jgi:serine/threonine-protein kinase RsbW
MSLLFTPEVGNKPAPVLTDRRGRVVPKAWIGAGGSDDNVLRLAAQPESAALVRHAAVELAAELGAAAPTRAGVAVAVTEAVANVVVHAYRDGPLGDVEVVLRGDGRRLEILVCDTGVGLRPRDDSPGLGLGLGLMAALADAFEVSQSAAGGTRVRLCFELP